MYYNIIHICRDNSFCIVFNSGKKKKIYNRTLPQENNHFSEKRKREQGC